MVLVVTVTLGLVPSPLTYCELWVYLASLCVSLTPNVFSMINRKSHSPAKNGLCSDDWGLGG